MADTPVLADRLATDQATGDVSLSLIWALQPNTATNIYRAGRWPRMDGNRYANQPRFPAP